MSIEYQTTRRNDICFKPSGRLDNVSTAVIASVIIEHRMFTAQPVFLRILHWRAAISKISASSSQYVWHCWHIQ
jgi:hypothetical protein